MFSGVRRSKGVQGLRVIVQSSKSPQYVENRIEAFLFNVNVSILVYYILYILCKEVVVALYTG